MINIAPTGLIMKSRAQIFAELRNSSDRMSSIYNENSPQHPIVQNTIHIDTQDETLTEVNIEEGDFDEGFTTLKPKKRGRGHPRKNNK